MKRAKSKTGQHPFVKFPQSLALSRGLTIIFFTIVAFQKIQLGKLVSWI
jgi:hypothetical protein